MSDAARRGLRTGLDVLLATLAAVVATVAVFPVLDPDGHLGVSAETVGKVGAALAVVTYLVSHLKNSLEDSGAIRAFGKPQPLETPTPASPPASPAACRCARCQSRNVDIPPESDSDPVSLRGESPR